MPEITWLKYGEKLEESLDVQIKQEVKELEHGLKEIKYYLYFPAGRHCDTGSYTLQAKNKYGELETSAHLDILLKPEIEGFKDQISVPFKTVTFEGVYSITYITNKRKNSILSCFFYTYYAVYYLYLLVAVQ